MTTHISPSLAGLLDDAALFPPASTPLPDAVPAHHRHREAWYAPLVGPFLMPAARLDALRSVLDRDRPLDLGLIAPAEALPDAVRAVGDEPSLVLTGVEVAPSAMPPASVVATVAGHLSAATPVAVEVGWDADRAGFLDALAGAGLRAKLRTGGTEAAAFPTEAALARAIADCRDRGVAFKCTAGLHHAVRHTAPDTGFEHHGYLNLLLAADAAARGAPADDLAAWLAERSTITVTDGVRALPEGRLAAARRLFVSFGTCSITEPVDDLLALGVLPATAQATEDAR